MITLPPSPFRWNRVKFTACSLTVRLVHRWCHCRPVINVPTFTSCIHRITHRTTDRRHASKNVMLIMPLGWTASGGVGMCGSQRCKANWTYWVVRQRNGSVCCAGRTSVESCGKMATRIDRLFLATSDTLNLIVQKLELMWFVFSALLTVARLSHFCGMACSSVM